MSRCRQTAGWYRRCARRAATAGPCARSHRNLHRRRPRPRRACRCDRAAAAASSRRDATPDSGRRPRARRRARPAERAAASSGTPCALSEGIAPITAMTDGHGGKRDRSRRPSASSCASLGILPSACGRSPCRGVHLILAARRAAQTCDRACALRADSRATSASTRAGSSTEWLPGRARRQTSAGRGLAGDPSRPASGRRSLCAPADRSPATSCRASRPCAAPDPSTVVGSISSR